MKIKVGFSVSDLWFSKIICLCTRSNISHTYISLYDTFFKTDLIVHVDGRVCIVREKEFVQENDIIEEFQITDSRLDVSVNNNLRHLRKKFNWWDFFGWMPIIKRWMKTKIKSPTQSFQRMICVDFVLKVLNEAGVTHLPYGIMTPEMLNQWFNHYYEKMNWIKCEQESEEKK